MLDLCIEFGAGEDHDEGDPQPHEQADERPERSVGGVIVGEMRQIKREEPRGDQPQQAGGQTAGGHPAPFRFAAARPIAVKDRERHPDDAQQDRPAQGTEQGGDEILQPDCREDEGNHDDGSRGQQQKENGPEGERKRREVEPDEAPLLLLLVRDVQRVEDRLGAGVGAPDGKQKPEHRGDAKRAIALRGNSSDLAAEQLERVAGMTPARTERCSLMVRGSAKSA